MVSKGKKPFYRLGEVRSLILAGRVCIRRNSSRDARNDFGWDTCDIVDAMSKLQLKHFYKSAASRTDPSVVLDFYKARGLKGEDVYTHFYIDDRHDVLVINSFKRI